MNVIREIRIFFTTYKKFAIALILLIMFLVARQFIAVGFPNWFENPPAIGSVALDRWQMNRVNRIVIIIPEGYKIIEDISFIRSFARQTMVAREVAVCVSFMATIHLYRNDTLVREMVICDKHDNVRVYASSPRHFFFFTSGVAFSPDCFCPDICMCFGGGLAPVPRDVVLRIFSYTQQIRAAN